MGGYFFCGSWGLMFLCFVSVYVPRSCGSVVSGVFCYCATFLFQCFGLFFLLFLGFSASVFRFWSCVLRFWYVVPFWSFASIDHIYIYVLHKIEYKT